MGNVLRQKLINFISSKDVAFVNLTAHERIKYLLTADNNNTCKIIAKCINLGPVVRSFLCSKAFSRIIFFVIFRASHHQLVDNKIKPNMLFKFSNPNSKVALTLGYLNPALYNSALMFKRRKELLKI